MYQEFSLNRPQLLSVIPLGAVTLWESANLNLSSCRSYSGLIDVSIFSASESRQENVIHLSEKNISNITDCHSKKGSPILITFGSDIFGCFCQVVQKQTLGAVGN